MIQTTIFFSHKSDGFYNKWMMESANYLADLTRIWGQAVQHGLWNHFDDESRYLTGLKFSRKENGINFNHITLDDLLFIFYIYGFGHVFGAIIFFVEMLIQFYCNKIMNL